MNSQVEKLKNIKQYEQRTDEWYAKRQTLLTASSISTLLIRDEPTSREYVDEFNLQDTFNINGKPCNPYSDKNQYIKEKSGHVQGTFTGNVATLWGQKYEPIATQLYSLLNNGMDVIEFGLIVHPTISWLGASPDGITPEGKMLEIKCPFRRKINGIPPFYYWIQCQIQLEVCDLEVCDFFECEFIECISFEEFLNDTLEDHTIYYKGIIIQDTTKENSYRYLDKNTIGDVIKIQNEVKSLKDNEKVIYWKLVNYALTPIKRSKVWFDNVMPVLKEEWENICNLKNNSDLLVNYNPKCIFK